MKPNLPGWKFLIAWTTANWFGWLIGEELTFLVSRFFAQQQFPFFLVLFTPFRVAYSILSVLVTGAVWGACVGILQWTTIRRFLRHSWRWVVASVGGMSIGYAIDRWYAENIFHEVSLSVSWSFANVVSGILIGLALGTTQWLVLRKQISRAGLWVIATIVATAAWAWLTLNVAVQAPLESIVVDVLSTFVNGLITGILFIVLMSSHIENG